MVGFGPYKGSQHIEKLMDTMVVEVKKECPGWTPLIMRYVEKLGKEELQKREAKRLYTLQ
jgi:hypothetical protein